MVEGLIVTSALIALLGGCLYLHGAYTKRLEVLALMRQMAWSEAMHGCDRRSVPATTITQDIERATFSPKSFLVRVQPHDAEQPLSARMNAPTSHSTREESYPDTSTVRVPCNEPETDTTQLSGRLQRVLQHRLDP